MVGKGKGLEVYWGVTDVVIVGYSYCSENRRAKEGKRLGLLKRRSSEEGPCGEGDAAVLGPREADSRTTLLEPAIGCGAALLWFLWKQRGVHPCACPCSLAASLSCFLWVSLLESELVKEKYAWQLPSPGSTGQNLEDEFWLRGNSNQCCHLFGCSASIYMLLCILKLPYNGKKQLYAFI